MFKLEEAAKGHNQREDAEPGEFVSTEVENPLKNKRFFQPDVRAMREATYERLRKGAHGA